MSFETDGMQLQSDRFLLLIFVWDFDLDKERRFIACILIAEKSGNDSFQTNNRISSLLSRFKSSYSYTSIPELRPLLNKCFVQRSGRPSLSREKGEKINLELSTDYVLDSLSFTI